MSTYRKKLIEVALPLEAINVASAREKSIRHGHPSTLHLWWARRPLAACRAVLFSSLVNDPGDDPMHSIDPEIEAAERAKLFNLIEDLVQWENSNNPKVINKARLEIARSIAANKVADGELEDDMPLVANAPALPEEQAKYLPEPPAEYTANDVRWRMPGLKPEQVNHFLAHYAPPVLDPFAGGGSIPLEAQRLGLRAYASDLNPVPILINKALIEIPPKFAGMPPVNPEAQKGRLKNKEWHGAEGLADDVRYYGKWMRDEAEKRIGHLYPKVKVTQEMVDDGRPDLEPYVGQELTVIAWLWARTVKSPNPAAKGQHVPLVRSFWLSKKKGKEVWLAPRIDTSAMKYEFKVRLGKGDPPDGTVGRNSRRCLLTDTSIPPEYVREEGRAGNLSRRMLAVVAEGKNCRVYFSPNDVHESAAECEAPSDVPETDLVLRARYMTPTIYGITKHKHLFTERQLASLTTFSDMIEGVRQTIQKHAEAHRQEDTAQDYANAVATFLAFGVSKLADRASTLASWDVGYTKIRSTFGRQALSMSWDFAEGNPFCSSTGNWVDNLEWGAKVLEAWSGEASGTAVQRTASDSTSGLAPVVVSTDPPYYDNVPYADLADFFYVWLRRSIQRLYPNLLQTLLTPKTEELVADRLRHGSNNEAKKFFEQGMRETFGNIRNDVAPDIPTTIYYAFKQSENDGAEGVTSTGWETFLQALIDTGWEIDATWPMRTELGNRMRGLGSNALASSIVLACRPQSTEASMATRRDFANALRKKLPEAIKHLQSGNVAPVDLAQASIGPGMAVFSRYSKVVNADGSPMSVREALQLINQVLDESLTEQESDFDAETRFALKWFEQHGMSEGPFGDAETLAKAMAVAVKGIEEAGIARGGVGKVRLLQRDEMDADWDPTTDSRLTMWEVTQHLIRKLEYDGESGAGALLAKVGSANGEIARELAYRLYQTCERKKLAEQARSYNALVVSWPEITRLAVEAPRTTSQTELFE